MICLVVLAVLWGVSGVLGGNITQIVTDGAMFREVGGRQIVFHGTAIENAAAPPYLSDVQMDTLVKLGFNVLRVGFHWHLYEPERGNFNETYLELLTSFVKRVNEHGIYVVLDMHQDSLCSLTCGHGVPGWAAHPDIDDPSYYYNGSNAFPLPWTKPSFDMSGCIDGGLYCPVTDCGNVSMGPFGWATAYLTPWMGAGFQQLYDNTTDFSVFWQRIGERFRGENGVMAYAILNEPWLGDVFKNPDLLIPGQADKINMHQFYASIAQALQKVDNQTLTFFEPATGGNILDATPIGYDTAPASALSAHVYCPLIESDMPYRNASQAWEDFALCRVANALQLDIRYSDAQRLNVPWMLTEFGAVDQSNVTINYLDFMTEQMDAQTGSWMYWLLTPGTSVTDNWESPVLSRTYLKSIPGTLLDQSFSRNSSQFQATFQLSSNPSTAKQPLELFASPYFHYTNGYTLQTAPKPDILVPNTPWSRTTGVATYSINPSLLYSLLGQNITVSITKT